MGSDIVEMLDRFLQTKGLYANRADAEWMERVVADAKAEILSLRQQRDELAEALRDSNLALHSAWKVATDHGVLGCARMYDRQVQENGTALSRLTDTGKRDARDG